ncbi:MAG: hypothetical protein RIB30_07725 [Thalassospira sp.]|uniref:hypothetical protein n=1 Tax=Thalassospira sp. TaxID=1912094 RepID=UPI0032ED0C26
MSTDKIFIRTVANPVSGMGHLSRMLTLATDFKSVGYECVFGIEKCAPVAAEKLNSAGFVQGDLPSGCQIVIYDLIDAVWYEDRAVLFREISQHREVGRKVVLFDGRGKASYRMTPKAAKVDFLVAPYVGEDPNQEGVGINFLTGPSFFPLATGFCGHSPKNISRAVRNVLITAGGADPFGASAFMLEAVLKAFSKENVEIHLVVGSMFNDETIEKIEDISQGYGRLIFCHQGLSDLSDLMKCADLCLCANGLTKYELVALGVPTIVVSINAENHSINLEFENSKTVVLAGELGQLSVKELSEIIVQLTENVDQREQLSQLGRQLIDGNGLERIRARIGLETQC